MQLAIGLVLLVILVAQVTFLSIHHRELREVMARYWLASGTLATLLAAVSPTGDESPAADAAD